MKVFKSEAKSLACAAYARDVLNLTDAVGLDKNTYLNAWKYVRQYDKPSLQQSALHCADILHGLLEEGDEAE
eukprot:4049711-Amphidinium_carterae.1